MMLVGSKEYAKKKVRTRNCRSGSMQRSEEEIEADKEGPRKHEKQGIKCRRVMGEVSRIKQQRMKDKVESNLYEFSFYRMFRLLNPDPFLGFVI